MFMIYVYFHSSSRIHLCFHSTLIATPSWMCSLTGSRSRLSYVQSTWLKFSGKELFAYRERLPHHVLFAVRTHSAVPLISITNLLSSWPHLPVWCHIIVYQIIASGLLRSHISFQKFNILCLISAVVHLSISIKTSSPIAYIAGNTRTHQPF